VLLPKILIKLYAKLNEWVFIKCMPAIRSVQKWNYLMN
jgi:hypothetical protein